MDNEETLSQEDKRKLLLDELDRMIENIDNLPAHAKVLPINHYDFGSLLILLSAIFRAD
jgi:hypothetical protein